MNALELKISKKLCVNCKNNIKKKSIYFMKCIHCNIYISNTAMSYRQHLYNCEHAW